MPHVRGEKRRDFSFKSRVLVLILTELLLSLLVLLSIFFIWGVFECTAYRLSLLELLFPRI